MPRHQEDLSQKMKLMTEQMREASEGAEVNCRSQQEFEMATSIRTAIGRLDLKIVPAVFGGE